ncbi:MAG: hypothetical protein AAB296_03780, partial [Candidatus Desantisbacteria bacterium]
QPATITITAIGTTTNASTNTPFYVTSKIVSISPNSGTIGTVVEVKGQGYAAGETLAVDFGAYPGIPINPVTSTIAGSFTLNFTTVVQPYGTQTVRVRGNSSGRQASGTFSVQAIITMITPSKGTVGSLVTVAGTGFGSAGTITFGLDTNIRSTFTTTNGTFSKTFTVDVQSYGTKTITVFHAGPAQVKTGSFTIMPSIIVNPTEGTVGATINISGAGYASGENVEIVLGSTTTRTIAAVVSNGTFSTSFTVDVQAQRPTSDGSTTVTGFGTSIGTAATCGLYLRINITTFVPVQGTVGSVVTIKGNGATWRSGYEWQVNLDFGAGGGSIPVNSDGTFEYNYVVDTQYAGTKTVVVIDEFGGGDQDRATKTYKILPNLWIVTPTTGIVGTLITVEGNGYGISETVEVLFNSATRTTMVTSSNGTFTANFTASWVPYGDNGIVGTSASGVNSPVNFFVLPKVLGVDPTSGTVGTLMTVWGNGFGGSKNGGTRVKISFGTTPSVVVVNADTSTGSFTASFNADIQPATTTITAFRINAGNQSAEGTDTAIFIVKGRITEVTPQIGTIGTAITIKGDGWAANESIRVDFGKTIAIATITSPYNTSAGTFSYTFTVDDQPAGLTSITATGLTSYSVWGTKTFQIKGRIGVSPSTGTVGAWVTVTGSGFVSTDGVAIHFGKTSTITQISSNANGMFTAYFTVDTQYYGTTTVKSYGQNSGWAEDATFTITGEIIEVLPNSGTVGVEVVVRGNGFGVSEQVRIDFGGHVNIVQTTASDAGTFTAVFTVDSQGFGAKEIKAIGQNTSTMGTDSFTIGARITAITPSKGTVGSQVQVDGDGFGSGTAVSIIFGSAGTVTTVTSTGAGTFSGTFTARSQSYGSITITAKDTSGAQASSSNYTICPNITSILPAQGTIGQIITINGEGFKYGEVIDISISGSQVVENCIVNSSGSMNGTFTVGSQTGGTKTVLAAGQQSTSA